MVILSVSHRNEIYVQRLHTVLLFLLHTLKELQLKLYENYSLFTKNSNNSLNNSIH